MTDHLVSSKQINLLSFSDIEGMVKRWKLEGQSVALCHGCFDPLHIGHIRHFEEASEYADKLIVTVTKDVFVNKGENRPFFCEADRLSMITALRIVDACALCPWDSAVQVIERLLPEFYVKGIDYQNLCDCNPNVLLEKEVVERYGGKLVCTSTKKTSSTALMLKILQDG